MTGSETGFRKFLGRFDFPFQISGEEKKKKNKAGGGQGTQNPAGESYWGREDGLGKGGKPSGIFLLGLANWFLVALKIFAARRVKRIFSWEPWRGRKKK